MKATMAEAYARLVTTFVTAIEDTGADLPADIAQRLSENPLKACEALNELAISAGALDEQIDTVLACIYEAMDPVDARSQPDDAGRAHILEALAYAHREKPAPEPEPEQEPEAAGQNERENNAGENNSPRRRRGRERHRHEEELGTEPASTDDSDQPIPPVAEPDGKAGGGPKAPRHRARGTHGKEEAHSESSKHLGDAAEQDASVESETPSPAAPTDAAETSRKRPGRKKTQKNAAEPDSQPVQTALELGSDGETPTKLASPAESQEEQMTEHAPTPVEPSGKAEASAQQQAEPAESAAQPPAEQPEAKTSAPANGDDALSVDQAAAALGITRARAYKLIESGRLTAYKKGRSWRIPVEAISQFNASK